jgi:hypothetical protein
MTLSSPFAERTLAELAEPLKDMERKVAAGIGTVVLPLGPYRNLTTLLGAIFALHPQAVVLNHADRIFSAPGVDFAETPDEPTLRRFIEAAVRLAQAVSVAATAARSSWRMPSTMTACASSTSRVMAARP